MPCSCGVCQECDWARNHPDFGRSTMPKQYEYTSLFVDRGFAADQDNLAELGLAGYALVGQLGYSETEYYDNSRSHTEHKVQLIFMREVPDA